MSYDVKGKSISDIMGMSSRDFRELSKSDLRAATQRLASAANKRLDRMTEAGEKSPAVRSLEKSGGRISTKGKDETELRKEFMRAKNFLQSKTSSLSGWHKVKRDASKKAKARGLLTDEQQKKQKPPVTESPKRKTREQGPAEAQEPEYNDYEDYPEPAPPRPEPEPAVEPEEAPPVSEPETEPETEPEKEPEVPEEQHPGSKVEDKFPDFTDIQKDKIWDVVDDMVELDPKYKDRAFRYWIFDAAAELKIAAKKKTSYKRIGQKLKGRMKELYAKANGEEKKKGADSISSYFYGPNV